MMCIDLCFENEMFMVLIRLIVVCWT